MIEPGECYSRCQIIIPTRPKVNKVNISRFPGNLVLTLTVRGTDSAEGRRSGRPIGGGRFEGTITCKVINSLWEESFVVL